MNRVLRIARGGLLLLALAGTAACGGPHGRHRGPSPTYDRVEKMFVQADVDKDEWLTPAELASGFPWLAGKFAEIDTDNNGKISLAELASYIELQQMQADPHRRH